MRRRLLFCVFAITGAKLFLIVEYLHRPFGEPVDCKKRCGYYEQKIPVRRLSDREMFLSPCCQDSCHVS